MASLPQHCVVRHSQALFRLLQVFFLFRPEDSQPNDLIVSQAWPTQSNSIQGWHDTALETRERETERNDQPLRCTLAWKNTTCGRSPTDDSEDLGSFFTQPLPLQCSTKAAEPRQVRRGCPFRLILPQKVWLFPASECEFCL